MTGTINTIIFHNELPNICQFLEHRSVLEIVSVAENTVTRWFPQEMCPVLRPNCATTSLGLSSVRYQVFPTFS